MAIYTGPYVGAKSCTSGPQPGAWGAMDYFLSAYKSKGGVNTGIYNCRSVRGGRTTSLHGEGRAADFGIRPYGAKWGTALANALVAHSKELGIQCVIWNRKIWSSSYPRSGWRRYSGVASHTDHIHVEFTWARAKAGRKETAQHFAKVLGGVKPGDVKTGGGGGSATYRTVKYGQMLRLYTKGAPVKEWQRVVGVKADGYFGPSTASATKKWQKANGLAADGIVGPKTWAKYKSGGRKAKPKGKPFPLPKGHWFGPESRDKRNHSGYWKKDRPAIRDIQRKVGTRVDGGYGRATKRKVEDYQRRHKLNVDGGVGIKTWNHMFNR